MVWLLCRLLYTLIIIKYQGFSDLPFHYALSCSFLLVIPFPPFNFRVPRFSHLSFIITPWVHREQSSQESIVPCLVRLHTDRKHLLLMVQQGLSSICRKWLCSVQPKCIIFPLLFSRYSVNMGLLVIPW